ncbi:MAG: hypothetical protein KF845_15910 [Cyclobacteriaceae bacterium]|nr:hypothetical protein [Cyclobacteriaceae bacterium]
MRFFIVALFFTNGIYAQPNDTIFIAEAIRNAVSLYGNQMTAQSRLINGSSYNRVQLLHNNRSHLEDAHPYYTFEWIPGTVLYDGEWYETSLLYDVSSDNLIMFNTTLQKQILLVKEKVEQFTLNKHHFVRLNEGLPMGGGFYEVTYSGPTPVYIRTKKNMERAVGNNATVPYKYVTKNFYYIKKGNHYYAVKSKSSVLKVLSEQRAVLKELMRLKSFRDNRAFFISEMARIYDHHEATK